MKHAVGEQTYALAHFASGLKLDAVPTDVKRVCKMMMLDAFGCALAATSLGDGCGPILDMVIADCGLPESRVIGNSRKLISAKNAAFANGALVHALNFDAYADSIGHAGVPCLAAPLAVTQREQGTGSTLLAASIVACEISARITAAVVRTGRHPSERFLAGQLLSYLGAAAGSARALELPPGQMASAFGLALMQMAGTRQLVLQGEPPAKAIYGGFPNQAGVQAALLAAHGLDARFDVFGPPAGLFSMIYDGVYAHDALTSGLGEEFLVLKCAFKPWPTSKMVHAFLEAALRLRRHIQVGDEIDRVDIVTAEKYRPWCEPRNIRIQPPTAAAAANSVPFCVARALISGEFGLQDVGPKALRNGETVALAQRIRCSFDATVAMAHMRITRRDGAVFEESIPHSQDYDFLTLPASMVHAKFRNCCAQMVNRPTDEAVDRIIKQFESIESIGDVRCIGAD